MPRAISILDRRRDGEERDIRGGSRRLISAFPSYSLSSSFGIDSSSCSIQVRISAQLVNLGTISASEILTSKA
jgi:type 1 fimbria pilin